MSLAGLAGEVYSGLVSEALLEERERKKTIEQRATAVVTTSGAVVSLLAALAAFVLSKSQEEQGVGPLAALLVAIAVVAFVVAVALGIHVNNVRSYLEADTSDLMRISEEPFWSGDSATAAMRVTQLRIRVLEVARKENTIKARHLRRALQAQTAVIVVLAAAVGAAFWGM